MTFDATIKEMLAEKICITARRVVMLHPEVLSDARLLTNTLQSAVDLLALDIDAYVIGMPKERIDVEEQWPVDWWQAFRERWFPAWWRHRWPVRYKSVSIHKTLFGRVCPHIRMPHKKQHLEWLAEERTGGT